jgi:hypothetical protein
MNVGYSVGAGMVVAGILLAWWGASALPVVGRPESPAQRPFGQTLSSQSEWYIVDVLQIYAKSLGGYWARMLECWCMGAERDGWPDTVLSQYAFMQVFMGALITSVFLPLAIVSKPLELAIRGMEADAVCVHLTRPTVWHPNSLWETLHAGVDGDRTRFISDFGDVRIEAWLPRYKAFGAVAKKLCDGDSDLAFASIAGNDHIAIKWRPSAQPPRTPPLFQLVRQLQLTANYSIANHHFMVAITPVTHLCTILRRATIDHVFDF